MLEAWVHANLGRVDLAEPMHAAQVGASAVDAPLLRRRTCAAATAFPQGNRTAERFCRQGSVVFPA